MYLAINPLPLYFYTILYLAITKLVMTTIRMPTAPILHKV